jgi:hypothetical protein
MKTISIRQLHQTILGAGTLLFALHWTGPSSPGATQPTLEERVAAIEEVAAEPEGTRVVLGHISRRLGVPVETLRAQIAQTGLGLGDLLVADRLAAETGLPLDQIVREFRGGRTWTQIAEDHAVDLPGLISYVAQSQEAVEQRSEDRSPAAHGGETPPGPSRGGGGGRGPGAGRPSRR